LGNHHFYNPALLMQIKYEYLLNAWLYI
jgi:hypothetical protein